MQINTIAGDRSFTNRDIEQNTLLLNKEVSTIGKLQQRGFYLAFQNSGACVALFSVRVYYKTCSEIVRGLAHFPETMASSTKKDMIPVAGVCLKDATEEAGLTPKMHCSSEGEWLVLVGRCRCIAGFEDVGERCAGKCARL